MLPAIFKPPTLKRHKPVTVRRDVAESYHGCLIVYVPKSRRLYWRVEGVMAALTELR